MAVVSIKNKTKSGSLLVGNAAFIPTDYESIATVTVGSGGSATVSFTSISSDYTHLQIRGFGQASTTTEQYSPLIVQFNSDTTKANYYTHRLFGNGASVSAASQQEYYAGQIQDKYGSAATFSGIVIDILDYKNTNKYKTVRTLIGGDVNGAGGTVGLYSMLWQNTNAITAIDLAIIGGSSPVFTQYSHFALYGIKGA